MALKSENASIQRGSRFPSIPLEGALEYARRLFDKDKRVPIDREIAAKHLGYAGITGSSARVLASMSYFGLVENASDSRLRVTDLAFNIFHAYTELEKYQLLKEVIKTPKIFDAILTKNGGIEAVLESKGEKLPSDETLIRQLTREHGFINAESAKICVKSLRESIFFVSEISNAVTEAVEQEAANKPLLQIESYERPSRSEANLGQLSNPTSTDVPSDMIPGKLSSDVRVELRLFGKIGPREAKKLKSWLQSVVNPWVDYMVEDMEEETEDF